MNKKQIERGSYKLAERLRAPELLVLDRLEVGPVQVESARVTATYTVTRGNKTDANDLVLRFEEDVFNQGLESQNLACMMVAQLALNYGLFCKKLVFRGVYDANDRRFIQTFAENTAREIYVSKILSDNPFLVGPASTLTAQRCKRYLQSEIEFVQDDGLGQSGESPSELISWAGDSTRHAVLSSGGKDSLLAFGLLREIGVQVDPIFVNESGRHWYTALNAYRHLRETHDGTARVWTNSDRLFTWMLRKLSFVRQDFSRVRSDGYPIRLWTVAVFAFAVLPLIRKRGIGRLIVGDEFDTTVRANHEGISHYDGLYDQSRFFDNEMSRYYSRKGWSVSQFSVLRPMSELLIQKALVERFPDLQRHQVSCHATHIDEARVRPCGGCEKCRRIVAMLLAIGADPSACGYTEDQAKRCLDQFVRKGVYQELAGAEQLMKMLIDRGIVARADGSLKACSHPEILSLRFHAIQAPLDGIPKDLRKSVYSRLMDHAEGALLRNGRVWNAFNPTGKAAMAQPYVFEKPRKKKRTAKTDSRRDRNAYLLAEMTWPEAEARIKRVDVALLPIGAIEQHGPHLPLDTDSYDADYLSRRVAEACSDPKPLVLPPIAYGVSYHHQAFAGTMSVSPETQARMVYEIGLSVARNGITKLIMVNGHGGNAPALHLAAQMINRDAHIFTCVDTGETSDADIHELLGAPNDVHAGEIETSTTLAIRPHLVKMSQAPKAVPKFSSSYLDFTSSRSVGWYAYTERISRSGVMGDATKATAEKGEKIWKIMTDRLVELVEDLKNLSLDEIHQRRY